MAQDVRHFLYSSDYPMPLFTCKFIGNTALSAGFGYTRFKHNLPYIPLLTGQWDTNSNFNTSHDISSTTFQSDLASIVVYADSTYIYFNYYAPAAVTIYYRLWGFTPTDYSGDVSPISDDSNFIFDTDYQYIKLAKTGKVSSGQGTTITHDLGYVPLARVWKLNEYGIGQGQTVKGLGLETSSIESGTKNAVIDSSKLYIGSLISNGYAYYHIYGNEA